MAHRVVTLKATRLVINVTRMRFDRTDDFLMTLAACPLSYFPPMRRNLNVVWEPAGGEVIGMPESVARFRHVLTNKLWRRVTVVANGHRAMARLDPAGILLIHDVAIHACVRIVCHVGIAARVHKRVCADSNSQTKCDT